MKRKIFLVLGIAISMILAVRIAISTIQKAIAIIIIAVLGIVIASFLGEQPIEFFDNFGNFNKSRVSAVLMGIILIAIIIIVMQLFK